jgi:hypothetical protein
MIRTVVSMLIILVLLASSSLVQANCADSLCEEGTVGNCQSNLCEIRFTGDYSYFWDVFYFTPCSGGGYKFWLVKYYQCTMAPPRTCEYDPSKSNVCALVECTDCEWTTDSSGCIGTPAGSPSAIPILLLNDCCVNDYFSGAQCNL